MNPAEVDAGGEPITIGPEDMEIVTDEIPGYEIASKNSLTVALDVTLTPKLKDEGNAREFVNKVQNIRKDSGFDLTDRISVTINENGKIQASLIEFKDYICREILASSLEFVPTLTDGTTIEVNEATVIVNVKKS
jgi:isoleucyl-tRNA synthetase